MKKLARLLLLLTMLTGMAGATTVTINVTDADGQTWNNGTWSAVLVNKPGFPGPPYYINGSITPVPSQNQSGTLNGSGSAAGLVLTDNTTIAPLGTAWNISVCPAATSPCFLQQVSIFGNNQTVNIAPDAIRINMSSPPPRAAAYADAEIAGALPGDRYTNLVDLQWHYCIASPCTGTNWNTLLATTGSAKILNGIPKCEQYPGATAELKVANCVAALTTGSGIVDARGFSGTIQQWATSIQLGNAAAQKYVTLLIDPTTTFQVTESDGGCPLKVDSGSSVISTSAYGPQSNVASGPYTGFVLSATANVRAVICNASTPQEFFGMSGVAVTGNASATATTLVDLQQVFVNSHVSNSVISLCPSDCLRISGSGPVALVNDWINGEEGLSMPNTQPVDITDLGAGAPSNIIFTGGAIEHAASGKYLVKQTGNGTSSSATAIGFDGTYFESATGGIGGVSFSDCLACFVNNSSFGGNFAVGATAVNVAQTRGGGTHGIQVRNISSGYTNSIHDAINGITITDIYTPEWNYDGTVETSYLPKLNVHGTAFFNGVATFNVAANFNTDIIGANVNGLHLKSSGGSLGMYVDGTDGLFGFNRNPRAGTCDVANYAMVYNPAASEFDEDIYDQTCAFKYIGWKFLTNSIIGGSAVGWGGGAAVDSSSHIAAYPATLSTTATASDNVAITGVTSTSRCSLTPTNASAATNIAGTYISAKASNQITVTHAAVASMTYDILCTQN